MDYRELLITYMAHVMDQEGTDFITTYDHEGGAWQPRSGAPFTPAEWEALAELSAIAQNRPAMTEH